MNVGIRELRSNLKRCLGEVKDGGEVVVTEYGRPVARIVPAEGMTAIDRLIEAGIVTRPRAAAEPAGATRRVRSRGEVASLVKEGRR